MPHVESTPHLRRFFPTLADGRVHLDAQTVQGLLTALDMRWPGMRDYILDERGTLRRHVNIFVGEQIIQDRVGLSDRLEPQSDVFIMQALSGG